MARILKCDMKNDCLVVQIFGDFILNEACSNFLEMLKVIEAYKANKVVVDCLQVMGAPSTIERFSYAESGADELMRLLCAKKIGEVKFAYVGIEPPFDKDHFGQIVANNRGANIKTFNNVEDAFSWLGKDPATK